MNNTAATAANGSNTAKHQPLLPAGDMPDAVLLVWLSGIMISLIYQGIAYCLFIRRVKRWGAPESDPDITTLLREQAMKVGVHHPSG